ncbi:MAG: hypothetical protein ACREJ6_00205 [Candidatus Methylomirabilis sp.]
MAWGIVIAGFSLFGMLALAVGATQVDSGASVATYQYQDEPVLYPAESEQAA